MLTKPGLRRSLQKFFKNVTLMFRQRKTLIFFGIFVVILMLVPALVIRLAGPGSFGDPNSGRGFGSTEWNGNTWVGGSGSSSPYYWAVLDDTNGAFGSLPWNVSDQNSNLYEGLIGQLTQKQMTYTSYRWPSCQYLVYTNYSTSNPILNNMYTYNVEGTVQDLKDFVKINYNYWRMNPEICWQSTTPIGLHVTSLQASNRSQQYSLHGTFYQTNYGSSTIISLERILRTALYGKALNYTYANEDFWNNDQRHTPFVYVNQYSYPEMPYPTAFPRNGFALTFYWIFSMLVLNFLTPIFTQRLVLERTDGLVDIAMMMGLNRVAHWVGHFVLDIVVYFFFYLLIMAVGIASSPGIALNMLSPWVLFSCLIYSLTAISTAYLFSFAFRSPRTCLILTYIYSLVIFAIVAVWNLVLLQPYENLPGYLMWWPTMNFFRLTYVGLLNSTGSTTFSNALTPILRNSMLALVFETIIVMLAVFLLDRFAPTKLGNRGTALNLITDGFYELYKKFAKRKNKDYDPLADEPLLKESGDARVAEERKAVLNGKVDDAIMVINQVTKVYAEGTSKFVALGGISFALKEGDCFGLLGPNGAGKSTLVAIMSGILRPTSGHVTVSKSHDRCAIGLCPQDDIFYDDLTVEEHLLYYSRLKGKGAGEDQLAVDAILADVSMANERRLYAASLSGGQKRRLSVASALCGDPMVVFLDEPSSSLDPGSRIGLWEIIQSISKTRCTLLTTHSMEEAEVLCNKIGIIKDGSMVCVGSSSQLKQSYGQGYKLLVTMESGAPIQPVLDQVASISSDASLISQKRGHYQIKLGARATLSRVSELMEQIRRSLRVAQWSLSRNGLDEVFLSIVEDRNVGNGHGYGAADQSFMVEDEDVHSNEMMV